MSLFYLLIKLHLINFNLYKIEDKNLNHDQNTTRQNKKSSIQ
jgi:hypothetical protein